MAEKKVQIDIVIETANAARSVKSITDSIVELKDAMKTVGEGSDDFKKLDTKAKQLESTLEGVASAAKKTDTNSKKAGKSISGLSLDIAKGISIAKLFEAGIGGLTNAFKSNQEGADFLATASGALTIVMNEVVQVLFDSAEEVGKTSNGFQALGTLLKSSFLVIINSVKLSFFGIKLALQEIRLAWEESFFGDEDPVTIERLNKAINETELQIVLAGEAIVENGKKVVDNFIPAIESVVDFTGKVIEGVSKINVTAAVEQSKANVQLQNSANEAEAQAGRLAAQYETQAEKLRQIRDDELLSIEERKKANDDLAKVLDDQEKALLKQADAGVAAAQSQLKINNTSQNRIALTKAQEARDRVLADIEGKRSEQKQNDLALTREQIELNQILANGEVERSTAQKDFANSQEKNQIRQLELTRENLVLQRDEELKVLQERINTFKEGTIARAEAEQEFLKKKQDLDNKIVETDSQIVLKRTEVANKAIISQADLELKTLEATGKLRAGREIELETTKFNALKELAIANGEDITQIESDYQLKIVQIREAAAAKIIEQTQQIGQQTLDIFNQFGQIQAENRQTQLDVESTNLEAEYLRKKEFIEKNVADETQRALQLNALDTQINNSRNEIERRRIELEKQGIKRERNLAIAEIALSTAIAISKAVAATSKTDPVTFALSLAANVAAVVTTIAKANNALKKADAAYGAIGAGGGGGTAPLPSAATSTPAAQTPNAFALFGTGANANNLNQGQVPQLIQAFVVESDVTGVQRRVERFRTASEL